MYTFAFNVSNHSEMESIKNNMNINDRRRGTVMKLIKPLNYFTFSFFNSFISSSSFLIKVSFCAVTLIMMNVMN